MVWLFHARAFRAGRYSFKTYMQHVQQVLNQAIAYTQQQEQRLSDVRTCTKQCISDHQA